MKIKFIDRDLMRRYGVGDVEINDSLALEFLKNGKAKAVTDFDRPPIHDGLRKEGAEPTKGGKSVDIGQGWPLVGWIHDTEKHGGAELSNFTVIGAGKEFGFGIYLCTPQTFDKRRLVQCDFLILNNFFFFEPKQYHFILDLLFEYKRPFVKYEHDHREIMGDEARPGLASILFGQSFLNIFISPFQAENHRKRLGDIIEPYYIIPPAVDVGKFRIIPGVERDPNKVVNASGRLKDSKGLQHMVQFVMGRQDLKYEIYTRYVEEARSAFGRFENVTAVPLIDNEHLPRIYNSAGYSIHLPRALEACGRTVAEGMLCGCKPIINKNVGIRSFKDLESRHPYHFSLEEGKLDLEKFRKIVSRGIWDFWRAVEMAYNGIHHAYVVGEEK